MSVRRLMATSTVAGIEVSPTQRCSTRRSPELRGVFVHRSTRADVAVAGAQYSGRP